MSEFSIHPVYLSARAAIVAPERAIPVTLYAAQKWLPRLGPERWCLVMLLRSLSLDSQRRGDGTKRIACSWRQLAEMLDVHELELRDRFMALGIPLRLGSADKVEARAEIQALSSWFSPEENSSVS